MPNLTPAAAYRPLLERLTNQNQVDAAACLESLPIAESVLLFRMLPKEQAAGLFSRFSPEIQQHIIASVTDRELSEILDRLMMDDTMDLLEEMPANVVKRILKNSTLENRKRINQFLSYAENSAGSVMTAEFIELLGNMTVKEAILHIRRTGQPRETIYTCYVMDPQRKLRGVVTVKDLLLARDHDRVEDLMETHVVMVATNQDREEAAALLARYDLLAIPVVDQEGRLVGIITVDDAVDVIEQETTEDMERMAALSPSEKPYLKTGVWELAKKRILWLLVLMISGMITGNILGRYEAAFTALPLLVTFIPMLNDTGGNAGSQSSTLIIRGMALSEIRISDLPAVIWKELRVGLLVGAVLSLINYIRLALTYPGQEGIAFVVALALFATVVLAKLIGGCLPMLAKFLHADPAIMAAPLITTIVDAGSLLLYFTIAAQLLGL